jgi:Flp pilus assembly pilin Flp
MWVQIVRFIEAKFGSFNEEEGQTIVEYALIIVLITLAVFAATPGITSAIVNVFSYTSSKLVPP